MTPLFVTDHRMPLNDLIFAIPGHPKAYLFT